MVFKIRIRRYDPAKQKQPRYQSYEVKTDEKPTVLELLKKIFREQDGEISFRRSCGMGKCGACAIVVNGRRVLACQRVAREQELSIEPVGDYPVIRDLTVALDHGGGSNRVPGETGQGGES